MRVPPRRTPFANAAVTPGLASAHFGHAGRTAKAMVEAGDIGFNNNGSSINGGGGSGAVVTGSGFYSVTSTWTEPSVTCFSTNDSIGIWVGIDGYGSSTVQQTGGGHRLLVSRPRLPGLVCDVPGPAGVLQPHQLPGARRGPHDRQREPQRHHLNAEAHHGTRGWTKTTTASLSAANASAEVIIESPTGLCPAFGTV